MDNRPRTIRVVEEYNFFDEERKRPVHYYLLPALKTPLKEIMFPQILIPTSKQTDVNNRNYRMNREAADDQFQDQGGEITSIISSDQDSKITRIDADVDDRKNKKVADDDSGVNVAVDSSTGDDRDKKRAEVKEKGKIGRNIQESQVDGDGFNKEKMRENVSSERNSINHVADYQGGEITSNISTRQDSKITRIDDVYDRKKKKFADADSVEEVPVHNHPRYFGVNVAADSSTDGDREKKRAKAKGKEKIGRDIQESQVDDGFNKKRENVNSSERNSTNHGVPLPLFHPRILQAIQLDGGTEQPLFLFEKKLDLGDFCSSYNRLYLTSCSDLLWGLTAVERMNLLNRLIKNRDGFLRVVTTDPKGVVYELHLDTNGVYVLLDYKWSALVTSNGLQQGDTLQGWGYFLGDEFCLALIFQRAT